MTLLTEVARLRLNVYRVRFPTSELETKLALEKLDLSAMAMKIGKAIHMYTTGPGTKDKKGLSEHATNNTITLTDIHTEQPRPKIAITTETRVCVPHSVTLQNSLRFSSA
jgi:hypothetical protein